MRKYRTIVYVDGFNFYYSIKRMYQSEKTPYIPARWREVLWLDLVKFSMSLLHPAQELVLVKYFTARVKSPKEKYERQSDYLDALKTLDKIKIIEGEYQDNQIECWHCRKQFPNPKEKQTDVNFATNLLTDAIENNFDTAYLISADSDYKAPLSYIRNRFPEKRIIAEFLETNMGYVISNLAHKTFFIDRNSLLASQLPDIVTTPLGYQLKRPASWK